MKIKNNIIKFKRTKTSVKKDNTTLYCPTCGKAKDGLPDKSQTGIDTYYCLNCGEALGVGIILGLKVICPNCEMLVVVG